MSGLPSQNVGYASRQVDETVSGVGTLDKAAMVLGELESGPSTLADLVERTGLPRATVHRLASALAVHGFVRRDTDGRYALGYRLMALGAVAAGAFPLGERARPALEWLRDHTGESVQMYVRDGSQRVCVAALDSPNELRTIVAVGAVLPLDRGSAGRVLLDAAASPGGWVASIAERAPGVASVSAAVRDTSGRVVAAVGVSGPIDRLSRRPGVRFGPAVVDAAAHIGALV